MDGPGVGTGRMWDPETHTRKVSALLQGGAPDWHMEVGKACFSQGLGTTRPGSGLLFLDLAFVSQAQREIGRAR